MKTSKFFFLLAMLASFIIITSCGSGSKSKTINPSSTFFTSGELAKYIKIVDQPSNLVFVEKAGSPKKQFIRLTVTLEAEDYYDEVSYDDFRDIEFTSLLSVAIVKLTDNIGAEITTLNVLSEDVLKLKKLIAGESDDDREDIIFQGEFHAGKNARIWFKEAAMFAPYLTGDITVNNKESRNVSAGVADGRIISGSKDWEELLNSFEKYADDLLLFAEKAKNGDVTAFAHYASLLEKAEALEEKLDDADEGDMSVDQMSRYLKIVQKMAKVAEQDIDLDKIDID